VRHRSRAVLSVLLGAAFTVATAIVGVTPASAEPHCTEGDPDPACNDYPDPPGSHDPTGRLDAVIRQVNGVQVVGWAVDPSIPGTLVTVDITIDGVVVGDVLADKPGGGDGGNTKFDAVVPARAGSQVCAKPRNIGAGTARSIGCVERTIKVDPFGAWESITHEGANVRVKGWAIDPDTTGTNYIEAYDENRTFLGTVAADKPRTDVGDDNSGYGSYHGFDHVFPENPRDGDHQICLGMVNVGPGQHAGLGCKSYTVRHLPWGSFDEMSRSGDDLWLMGWVVDDDAKTTPVTIDVFVDRELKASRPADRYRQAVGDNLPDYGYHHGYDVTVPDIAAMAPGKHEVCVEARNVGAGTADGQQLGCKEYTMAATAVAPVVTPLVPNVSLYATSVQLTWKGDPANQAVRIDRSVAGGPWQRVQEKVTVDRYTDRDVTADTRYCYRLTAYNDRPSEATTEVCATTLLPELPAPTGLTVTGRGDTSVTLRWTDRAPNETHYLLGYRVTGTDGPTVLTVPALSGTGGMTYTVTGLKPNTSYTFGVSPVNPAHDATRSVDVDAWTTGKPEIAAFAADPQRIQACAPQAVTLSVKTVGAVRVVVRRGDAVVADKTQPTQASWQLSVPAGSSDGNVAYTLTAYGVDGRTATATTVVQRVSAIPLVKSIEFSNTGWYRLEAWFYDLQGYKLQKVGDVAPGGRITITPGHCLQRRIQVIQPDTGRVAFMTNPQIVLGHNEAPTSQATGG